MKNVRLALVGFGNVGRRFAKELRGSYAPALRAARVKVRVTGIATGRHGLAIDPDGIALHRARRLVETERSLEALGRGPQPGNVLELIARVPADVLVEISTLDPRRGEPAASHVRQALNRGLHVVTANKGPVAFARRSLMALARKKGRIFLHESAVMDGTPVFNLVERCLPGCQVLGFRGTLNSTTNLILSRMEEGLSAGAALAEAQALGIAEADARNDLDGWDSAVKGCALAAALMGATVLPGDASRRGMGKVTSREVRHALREGARVRLVVRGERRAGRVRVGVRPERVPLGDPLVGAGADNVLMIQTDLMGEIGIVERGSTVDQTAYGLLSDLLRVVRGL